MFLLFHSSYSNDFARNIYLLLTCFFALQTCKTIIALPFRSTLRWSKKATDFFFMTCTKKRIISSFHTYFAMEYKETLKITFMFQLKQLQ